MLATRHGLSIRFHEQDVREMGRDTTGVKGIELGPRDEVIGMVVIKREATLLGSRNATMEDFETVLTAMRAGLIPDAALNTHRLPLDQVPTGFARLLDPAEGVVKAIVEC